MRSPYGIPFVDISPITLAPVVENNRLALTPSSDLQILLANSFCASRQRSYPEILFLQPDPMHGRGGARMMHPGYINAQVETKLVVGLIHLEVGLRCVDVVGAGIFFT